VKEPRRFAMSLFGPGAAGKSSLLLFVLLFTEWLACAQCETQKLDCIEEMTHRRGLVSSSIAIMSCLTSFAPRHQMEVYVFRRRDELYFERDQARHWIKLLSEEFFLLATP
jgi:hypothetical protein